MLWYGDVEVDYIPLGVSGTSIWNSSSFGYCWLGLLILKVDMPLAGSFYLYAVIACLEICW